MCLCACGLMSFSFPLVGNSGLVLIIMPNDYASVELATYIIEIWETQTSAR